MGIHHHFTEDELKLHGFRPGIKKLAVWSAVALISFILSCNLFVVLTSGSQKFFNPNSIPVHPFGLVLTTDQPAGIARRADSAALLLAHGKVERLIVSGSANNGGFNECLEMQNALIARGVSPNFISMDTNGLRTITALESFRSAHPKIPAVTLISEGYHLDRALFLASSMRIKAVGFSSVPGGFREKFLSREIFARCKAVAEVAFRKISG